MCVAKCKSLNLKLRAEFLSVCWRGQEELYEAEFIQVKTATHWVISLFLDQGWNLTTRHCKQRPVCLFWGLSQCSYCHLLVFLKFSYYSYFESLGGCLADCQASTGTGHKTKEVFPFSQDPGHMQPWPFTACTSVWSSQWAGSSLHRTPGTVLLRAEWKYNTFMLPIYLAWYEHHYVSHLVIYSEKEIKEVWYLMCQKTIQK